jgi:hypothetical protein
MQRVLFSERGRVRRGLRYALRRLRQTGAWGYCMAVQGRKQFFFEKKNQKTFICLSDA